MATIKVSENLQRGRSGGKGTGNRGDNTSKKNQETLCSHVPVSCFVTCSWARRLDGVAINEALQIVYILEFKQSTDRDEASLDVKEAEANEQHYYFEASLVRSEQLLQCGDLSRSTLLWATADPV